jgi:hypothetical protein
MCHARTASRRNGQRNSKISDEWLTFVQQNVFWFQIAVNYAVTVRVI